MKVFAQVKVYSTRCPPLAPRDMIQISNTNYYTNFVQWEVEAQIIEFPTDF